MSDREQRSVMVEIRIAYHDADTLGELLLWVSKAGGYSVNGGAASRVRLELSRAMDRVKHLLPRDPRETEGGGE